MDDLNTLGTPQASLSQKVAYTGTAGTTTAMPYHARVVRVTVTTDAFVQIGLNPTAVADADMFMVANTTEYFHCPRYGKVSAIQSSSGGNLYVTPF